MEGVKYIGELLRGFFCIIMIILYVHVHLQCY